MSMLERIFDYRIDAVLYGFFAHTDEEHKQKKEEFFCVNDIKAEDLDDDKRVFFGVIMLCKNFFPSDFQEWSIRKIVTNAGLAPGVETLAYYDGEPYRPQYVTDSLHIYDRAERQHPLEPYYIEYMQKIALWRIGVEVIDIALV